MSSVGEPGDGLGRQLGAEGDDHRITRVLLAPGGHHAARRVEGLNRRGDQLDPLPGQAVERALDLFRPAVPDRDPEQRGLEEVVALAFDQDHPMVARQRPAKPIGCHEPADAPAEDQSSLA